MDYRWFHHNRWHGQRQDEKSGHCPVLRQAQPQPQRPCPNHLWRKAARRGFTLIEAAIVTVIVGVGTVAMIQLLAAGSMANGQSYQLTTGINLANNIREMSQSMTFAQVLTLNNKTWSTPVDAMGQDLSGFSGWSQKATVTRVLENALTVATTATDSNMARVTVQSLHNNQPVARISWLVVNTE